MEYSSPAEPILLQCIGGFSTIGASSSLLVIDQVSLLLDCGLQTHIGDSPYPREIGEVHPDVVLLSHAHIDHLGALPIVTKNNPTVPVYTTLPTEKLARVMLEDARKLSVMHGQPIYSQDDIDRALKAIKPVDFEQSVAFRGLVFRFRRAGHILGAAMIEIRGRRKVLYTGDFSTKGTIVTPAPNLPPQPEPTDILICETTYGGRPVQPRESAEKRLLTEINGILECGGRVLIPCFALGRAQEVIALLVSAIRDGKLAQVPIFLDGMVKEVTQIYSSLGTWLTGPNVAEALGDWRIVKPVSNLLDRTSLVFGSDPCIIVASSGMLTGGWSLTYARDICARPDSAIFFVGYLDEESPGHTIVSASTHKIRLLDEEVVLQCKIGQFHLSAHASHEGILVAARSFPPRLFVAVHGDPSSRWKVRADIANLLDTTVILPYEGQEYSLSPSTKQSQLLLSETEQLAVKFLATLSHDELEAGTILAKLEAFVEKNDGDKGLSSILSFVWGVFRLCGNLVSLDPWTTIEERSRFYHAIQKFLSERYPDAVRRFARDMQRTFPSFIANLVLYGGNQAWLDHVRPIAVTSLVEVEAILVRSWDKFRFPKNIDLVDVYHRCRIRAEWSPGSDAERKFDSVFGSLTPLLPLLEILADNVAMLVVDDVLLGAVKGEVVLAVQFNTGNSQQFQPTPESLTQLASTKLFQLSGWKMDATKVKLASLKEFTLPEAGADVSKFRAWLLTILKPLANVAGGTVLAFSDIPIALQRAGFRVKQNPDFLDAVHQATGKRILVALDPAESSRFDAFKKTKGCVMEAERFKIAVKRLAKWWDQKEDPASGAQAASEVITVYGWRSNLPEDARHKALEDALEAYEFRHLLKILQYQENRWASSSKYRQYAVIAREDREWLQKTLVHYDDRIARNSFGREVRSFCGLLFSNVQFDRCFVVTL